MPAPLAASRRSRICVLPTPRMRPFSFFAAFAAACKSKKRTDAHTTLFHILGQPAGTGCEPEEQNPGPPTLAAALSAFSFLLASSRASLSASIPVVGAAPPPLAAVGLESSSAPSPPVQSQTTRQAETWRTTTINRANREQMALHTWLVALLLLLHGIASSNRITHLLQTSQRCARCTTPVIAQGQTAQRPTEPPKTL